MNTAFAVSSEEDESGFFPSPSSVSDQVLRSLTTCGRVEREHAARSAAEFTYLVQQMRGWQTVF